MEVKSYLLLVTADFLNGLRPALPVCDIVELGKLSMVDEFFLACAAKKGFSGCSSISRSSS